MTTISIAPIQASTITTVGSRYRTSDVLYYGPQKFMTFSTYKRTNYIKTGTEKVMLINNGVQYRPDLVSYDVYGFSDMWWKILEVNGMYDIWDFVAGKTIILPELAF